MRTKPASSFPNVLGREVHPLELGLVAKQKVPNNIELDTQGLIVSSKRN